MEVSFIGEENHGPVASQRQTFSHNVVSSTGFELTMLVVIGTDCTGRWKSNYRTITTTMAPDVKVHEWIFFMR